MTHNEKRRDRAAGASRESKRASQPSSHDKARPQRYALNLRLIGWTVAALAVGGPSVFGLHAYQVDRSVAAFLSRADEQESAKQWHDAAESLYRYLRLRPDDAKARARLAKDFDAGATTQADKSRAIELYAVALGQSPDDVDLLRRQMLCFLDTGDFTQTLDRADELLRRQPNDPAGLRGRALGLLARWRFKGEGSAKALASAFEQAIAKNAGDAHLAVELSRVYRSQRIENLNESRRLQLADEVMQRLIDSSSNKSEAYLARYSFRNEFGIADADADLDRALKADVEQADLAVRLAAASRALQRHEWKAASEFFEQAIRINQRDPRGYQGLGLSREGAGDEEGALQAWLSGLQRADANDLSLQLRVASSRVVMGQLAEANQTLDKLDRQVEGLLGPQKIDWMANVYAVRADAALAEQNYRAAIAALNEVLRLRRGNVQSPQIAALQAQVEQRLGGCHAALRQWDEAASAYQRAAELQPGLAAARFAAASAWEAADRLDEAVRQYEDGLAIEQAAAPLIALAHASFRQQLVLPKDKRDWRDFTDALANAQSTTPNDTSLKLLGAEFEIERNRPELAHDALRQLELDALTNPDLTRRLAFAYERCQRPEEADRILASPDLQKNPLATLLLRADLLMSRGELAEAGASLRKELSRLSPQERRRANYRLALIEISAGDPRAALKTLKELTETDRNDLDSLQLLAELSLDSDDLDQVAACVEAIKSIEGRDGATWRFYQAQRLLRKSAAAGSKKAASKLLADARSLAEEIERRRPNWALAHVLKARLNQSTLRPDFDAAVQAYFQAIRLGENRLRIYEELVLLLYQQNRLVEAAAYLERLRAAGSLSPVLSTMAMAVDARQGNLTRAIETARRDVERQPEDALARLRLGQLLAQAQPENGDASPARWKEAEAELRRAAALAPGDTRPWLALLTFFGQTKQAESARALLGEIERNESMTRESKPFVLAQGYLLIDDRQQADAFYRKAVDAAPDSLAVQVQAARFFFDSDKTLAERCLNQARDLAPDDANVRRLLAALRATQSMTEEDMDGILALLDGNGTDSPAEPADQRLKALLLLQRGGAQARQQAQKILETLVSDGGESAPIDRLLLARLYEVRGRNGLTAARQQLEALINRDKPRPDHLAIYVDHLLRHNQADQAADALRQLSELEPPASHSRTLALRARWLHASGRSGEIEPLVEVYQEQRVSKLGPPEQAAAWCEIATLYSLVELFPAAENSFRRALDADPASYVAYSMWLVQRGRTQEAVQLCSRAADADSGPRPAMTLCTVLALGQVSADERKAAEPLIEKALEVHSRDYRLLFSAATMRLMENKPDKAIALLRQVLEISPDNLQAMNNLAMLLAEQPGGEKEAISYVDRAISLKGLNPELLDTKGWILLRQNNAQKAEGLFLEAVSAPPGDPRHQLHLALAYQAQGKMKEARQMLARARENSLGSASLSPTEQTALAELDAALR